LRHLALLQFGVRHFEDNDAYSYHTYGQSDVYKIDPRYGTNEDYARLAAEMHKRK
jgi:glycosidase